MKTYRVIVSPDAADQIAGYAGYIAHLAGSDEVARNWILNVYTTIDKLEHFPRRRELAEENERSSKELRRLIIGNYLALFTIDDEVSAVRVIGFRHAARLPHPDEP